MPTIKVYRSDRYEAETDTMRRSTRMYTRDVIATSKLLTLVEETEAEIDSEDLVTGEGWTPENFTPNRKK
jgi:hypothetical protein